MPPHTWSCQWAYRYPHFHAWGVRTWEPCRCIGCHCELLATPCRDLHHGRCHVQDEYCSPLRSSRSSSRTSRDNVGDSSSSPRCNKMRQWLANGYLVSLAALNPNSVKHSRFKILTAWMWRHVRVGSSILKMKAVGSCKTLAPFWQNSMKLHPWR
jgi:hypothetical protein